MTHKAPRGIGRCIYCRREGIPLSEEHVIPRGLGGDLVLSHASCEACAKEILKFEQWCIRKTFEVPRTFFGVKSSPKHKKRKRQLFVGLGAAKETKWFLTELEKFPVAIGFPIMQPPSLLNGVVVPTDKWVIEKVWSWLSPTFQAQADALGGQVSVFAPFQMEFLARFLCKIAHGFAVSELGLDGFVPTTTDCIRNLEDTLIQSVVGMVDAPSKFEELKLHQLQMLDHGEYHTVLLQLFAPIALPTFQVVVGKRLQS